jgi:hypothetical protein
MIASGASGCGRIILLHQSTVGVNSANDDLEQILSYSPVIRAGTITPGSTLEIKVGGIPNGSTFTPRIRLGTTHTTADAHFNAGVFTWDSTVYEQSGTLIFASSTAGLLLYPAGTSADTAIDDVLLTDLYLSYSVQRTGGAGIFAMRYIRAVLSK